LNLLIQVHHNTHEEEQGFSSELELLNLANLGDVSDRSKSPFWSYLKKSTELVRIRVSKGKKED